MSTHPKEEKTMYPDPRHESANNKEAEGNQPLHGKMSSPTVPKPVCPVCKGLGKIEIKQSGGLQFQCHRCGGTGLASDIQLSRLIIENRDEDGSIGLLSQKSLFNDFQVLITQEVSKARAQVINRAKLLVDFHRDHCDLHDKHASRCAGCIRTRAALAGVDNMHYQLENWTYPQLTTAPIPPNIIEEDKS